jgi:hypothetical protein
VLRSFRVANHKSIRDEQELLLVPAYDKTRPVVPVAAIFGANASGKSNLLDALRWMQDAVVNSFAAWRPGSGIPRTPFDPRMRAGADTNGGSVPSGYAVEMVVDGTRFAYGFDVDDTHVREEWLYAYPHNRRRVIFDRRGDRWTFGSTVSKSVAEAASRMTRPNALFLTVAARLNLAEVQAAFGWFELGSRVGPVPAQAWMEEVARLLDGPRRGALVELIRAADVGVTDILSTRGLDDSLRYAVDLQFRHGSSETWLPSASESAGTLRWLQLMVATLPVLEAGCLLCLDELDTSMHPRLTASYVDLFRDEEINNRGAQLVFTTHDATLLSPILGDDTLHRDEIWFVEKDRDGATSLVPLSDFKPRRLENWERRYLGGSYGAVPLASEFEFRRAFDVDTPDDNAAA